MSFKIRIEEILKKYHLNPKKLGERLGYAKPDKLYRLLKDDTNSPSVQIIQDILRAFPDINARWLISGDDDIVLEDSRVQYGYCKECLKKEGVIEYQEKELKRKEQEIAMLNQEIAELGEKLRQSGSIAS